MDSTALDVLYQTLEHDLADVPWLKLLETVAVTGVAGPGGGSPEKPVGLVFLHASGPDGELAQRFELPGERDWIRSRAAVAALHLVRRLLAQSRDEAA